MVSQQKQIANHLNASKSTGPRSEAGKARSSRNALRHGFFTRHIPLDAEEAERFADLLARLVDEHNPQTPTQMLCVERIAHCTCKIQRIEAAAARSHAELRQQLRRRTDIHAPDPKPGDTLADTVLYGGHPTFEKLAYYEQRLQNMIHRALGELRKLRKEHEAVRELPPSPFAAAMKQEGDEQGDQSTRDDEHEPDPPAPGSTSDAIERNEATDRAEVRSGNAPECAITRVIVRNEPTDEESAEPVDAGAPSHGASPGR